MYLNIGTGEDKKGKKGKIRNTGKDRRTVGFAIESGSGDLRKIKKLLEGVQPRTRKSIFTG